MENTICGLALVFEDYHICWIHQDLFTDVVLYVGEGVYVCTGIHVRRAGKKMRAPLLGLAKSIY